MRPLESVATELAMAHRHADPNTTIIKFFPDENLHEVLLLEVSFGTPTVDEILPFRFGPDPANGVDYPSIVILVSPKEWQDIQNGNLNLPNGWDLSRAIDL